MCATCVQWHTRCQICAVWWYSGTQTCKLVLIPALPFGRNEFYCICYWMPNRLEPARPRRWRHIWCPRWIRESSWTPWPPLAATLVLGRCCWGKCRRTGCHCKINTRIHTPTHIFTRKHIQTHRHMHTHNHSRLQLQWSFGKYMATSDPILSVGKLFDSRSNAPGSLSGHQ